MKDTNYVWYACYGSNLSASRFHCYIAGGRPEGAQRLFEGCRDKTLPKQVKPISLPYELYFAESSKTWNRGGVGFIDPQRDNSQKTMGKRYLITQEQFIDLVKQESGLKSAPELDLERLEEEGTLVFDKTIWYGRLLYLGRDAGWPIVTFTNAKRLETVNPPDKTYLATIISGLQSCYQLTADKIQSYLSTKTGISGHAIAKELTSLTI